MRNRGCRSQVFTVVTFEKIMLCQTSPERTAANCKWTKHEFTPQKAACHWNARGSGNQSCSAHMAQGAFTGCNLDTLTWWPPGVNKPFFFVSLALGKGSRSTLISCWNLQGSGDTAGNKGIHGERLDLQDYNAAILHLQGAGLHYLFASFSALSFTRHHVSLSASGLVKSLPVILEWVMYRWIHAALPALTIF